MQPDDFHNDALVLPCDIQRADIYGKLLCIYYTSGMNSRQSKRSYLSRRTEYRTPKPSIFTKTQTSICLIMKLSKIQLWKEDKKKQEEVTKSQILIIRR